MSITNTFETDVLEQLATKGTTQQFILTPINQIQIVDTSGKTIETISNVNVQYNEGTVTVTAEFVASSSYTIGYILIGSYNSGVFKSYFKTTPSNTSVSAGQVYEVSATINLNNFTLNISPFTSATIQASKLASIIGQILAGSPIETGKSGGYFSSIYIINTTGKVLQSFRIPVTIVNLVNGVLTIGGVIPTTYNGNEIVVRDSAENNLIVIQGSEVITFKKGRQILVELSF